MEYLHNTTFVVEKNVTNVFTQWVKDVYLIAARQSGLFSSVEFVKILVEVDPSAVNYAVLMRSQSLSDAEQWHRDTATLLRDDLKARLGDRVMFFSTDMEVIR